jgi:hypothetical protein
MPRVIADIYGHIWTHLQVSASFQLKSIWGYSRNLGVSLGRMKESWKEKNTSLTNTYCQSVLAGVIKQNTVSPQLLCASWQISSVLIALPYPKNMSHGGLSSLVR